MMNLIKTFAFLGDSLHDCMIEHEKDIQSLADVGGMIEHKAMIADLTDQCMNLQTDKKKLTEELAHVSFMMEELKNVIINK